ncbi:DUF7552 domain-containing protein [Halorubellus litoreus]|uniref:DUF7552 domain-containing protein n=1 Tax=Halorubellus litoreus TaxID=755308 RepID=A0ABD5VJS0_9EURY
MAATDDTGDDRPTDGVADSEATRVVQDGAGAADAAAAVREARETIADLAADDGEFVVVGKDTGVSPDPVSSVTFDAYEAAERARDAAARYRAAMRDVDPDLPTYDLVVCERQTEAVELATVRESTDERRKNGVPRARQTVTVTGDRRDEWLRVENAPLVHLSGPESLLDDEFVTRQLQSKL